MWAPNRFGSTSSTSNVLGLSDDAIRAKAPSVFAERPWGEMSDKYHFVPTSSIIATLRENGYAPVRAMQGKSRIEGKADFTKHMVVFRDVRNPQVVGGVQPEIVLVNSHDGTSSYQLHAGMFRLVCANGLIVADRLIAAIRLRHSVRLKDDIIEGTDTLIREVPTMSGSIERFREIILDPMQQHQFARQALELRYGADEPLPVQTHDLLVPKRQEDRDVNLWTIYNRAEERLIKGGVRARTKTNKPTTTRAITSVPEILRMEKGLWDLMEDTAAALA